MSGGKLPEGWVVTNLQNIANWGSGGTPSRSHDEYYNGNIPWIKTGDLGPKLITEASEYITDAGVKNSSAKYFPKGSVAIAMYGATIGKTSILGIDATTNQACAVGTPIKDITSSIFLYYFLLNEKNTFIKKGKGGAQPNISQAVIKEHPLSLPPYSEQKIITEKLDTLLAQVDSTKARLEQIPQILKRFRQAVLSTAASGCLTNKWRERCTQKEEIDLVVSKYKPTDNLFKQAKQSLPDIPQSWRVVPSAHLIEYVTSGSRGWANYYSTKGALFLRMSNVRYNTTRLDLQDLQFVNLPSHVEGKRSLVKIDDLIISLTADVGRVARIDKDLGEAYINQHLALLRPNNNINSEYFALSIAAQNIGVKQIQSLKRGATKVGLGLDDIRSLAIPLPSLEEQHEIVRRVEQLFAYADTIEKQVNNALTRVNNLTQSILAKAFRGELTAQWRAENPDLISGENSAAAQLEKIKAERAASGGKKTSRKKS
ncbi:restriction endonuclease subunit S [Citrobacter werkmanii]|uniref:restriction endonuclease subunit S n=1 Tax=Citrobacter werkmanii TaxID=67827 RepID=UPI002F3353F2